MYSDQCAVYSYTAVTTHNNLNMFRFYYKCYTEIGSALLIPRYDYPVLFNRITKGITEMFEEELTIVDVEIKENYDIDLNSYMPVFAIKLTTSNEDVLMVNLKGAKYLLNIQDNIGAIFQYKLQEMIDDTSL